MKKSVIAIGLDAAEPSLLEKWMSQGYLPNLKSLKESGAYGNLTNIDYYKAETPWTTFLTGCLPEKTGYWGPFKFQKDNYNVEEIQAYDFAEYPPFYALGDDYRVAAFDIPQSVLSNQVNGLQVLAWGAHSPQTSSHSLPEELLAEINDRYGKHPALHRDHGDWWDRAYLTRLHEAVKAGIERRVAICQDWLKQEQWDLFLTIFGETHSAGHDLWYLSQTDHPLYPYRHNQNSDPMLEVFTAVDNAIGKILTGVDKDTYIVVFAAHGSGNNTTDVASMLFLPEFLYRFNFPGKVGIVTEEDRTTPSPMITSPKRKTWTGEIWQRKYEVNLLKRWLRSQLPSKFYKYLDRVFGRPLQDLRSPEELQQAGQSLFWQPTMWYSSFWSQMKAFALPSFSEGYIRINLEGREPEGIVSPEEYNSLCAELTEQLSQLKNARTGESIVKKVIRTRKSATEDSPKLPDADLVVVWAEQPADVIDHPQHGRIGPVPYRRTGSHRPNGFITVTGSGITPGSTLPEGHGVDLAPTILNLMGAPIPEYMDGKPLPLISVARY